VHGELDLSKAPFAAVGEAGTQDVRVVVVGDGRVRCVESAVIDDSFTTGGIRSALLPGEVGRDSSTELGFGQEQFTDDSPTPGFPLVSDNGSVGSELMLAPARDGGNAGVRELQKIHRLLRGRYLWAIFLAVMLGSAGGFGGFRLGSKLFRSNGAIRIVPVVPKVMYAVDEKGSIPMYETYVDAQLAMLKSQRVTQMAMDDPIWQQQGSVSSRSPEAIERFAQGLDISRQGELIWVRALNTNADSAKAAVDATIHAYLAIYDELETKQLEDRSKVRENVKLNLQTQYDALQDSIREVASHYGTDDLSSQFSAKQQDRNQLGLAIREMELSRLDQPTNTGLPAAAPTTMPVMRTPEDVAYRYRDGRMLSLLDHESQYREELEALKGRGLGPGLTAVKEAQHRLEVAHAEVQRYFEMIKKYAKDTPGGIAAAADPQLRLAALKEMYGVADKDMLQLGRDALAISQKREQAMELKKSLDEATRAIEQLSIERRVMGRVVPMLADTPLSPYKDTRAGMAIAGGMSGILLGFGSMLLLGLLRGRLEHPDDADSHLPTLTTLGVIPALPKDLTDPEHAALAAHSVHEIRTRLQILTQDNPRQTFGITSPTAGAGKTSLTLALGLSFAAANQRTLLIDCDIVGGGLTRAAEAIARRRIGQVLLRERLITSRQLEEALRASRRSRRRIGQTLVELGFVTKQVLRDAMVLQKNEVMGLLEALEGEDVLSCVAPSGIDGLHILPLGEASVHDAATLSPGAFRELIDRASRCFDVVIVDTGPILGSLEVSVVASQMDAMVLAVARGDSKSIVRKALTQLSVVGTRVAGMVFNRASHRDVVAFSSHSSSSSRSTRSGSDGPVVEHRDVPEAHKLGPVARAVASWSAPRGSSDRRAVGRNEQQEQQQPATTATTK
jgi:Mrp family chromosome partitioning ATPase